MSFTWASHIAASMLTGRQTPTQSINPSHPDGYHLLSVWCVSDVVSASTNVMAAAQEGIMTCCAHLLRPGSHKDNDLLLSRANFDIMSNNDYGVSVQ